MGKYIVAYTEYGETCDMHPRSPLDENGQALKFDTMDEATNWVDNDIKEYCDEHTFVDDDTNETIVPTTDFLRKEVWIETGSIGVTYSIIQI